MKFIVLNGSPKSGKSTTLQSIKYIEQRNKDHVFEYIHISKELKKYEEDENALRALCNKIEECHGVIWSFPVYYLLVPSPYKRFVELIFRNELMGCFEGKYTCTFSTSTLFFDHTAHNYIHGICDDLNMNFVDCLSHEINDLLKEEKRRELDFYFNNLLMHIEENLISPKTYKTIANHSFKYITGETGKVIDTDKKIVIVSDSKENNHNLNHMVKKYSEILRGKADILDLNDLDNISPCLGCCSCGNDNICVMHAKDNFRDFLDTIINYDIIIYAGVIKDRYLSSRFKLFFDRSFCYTHIPIFQGKQIGYMLSGNIRDNSNLIQIIEGYTQFNANLIGIVTDESQDNDLIDREIYSFAKLGLHYSQHSYTKTNNFLGVGGRKILRDKIAGECSFVLLSDYNYYKKHKLFKGITIKEKMKYGLMRLLMGQRKFREKAEKDMIDHMIKPHKEILLKNASAGSS